MRYLCLGYYAPDVFDRLSEADDLDEAVRIASLHPAARWGAHLGFALEVRPIEFESNL